MIGLRLITGFVLLAVGLISLYVFGELLWGASKFAREVFWNLGVVDDPESPVAWLLTLGVVALTLLLSYGLGSLVFGRRG